MCVEKKLISNAFPTNNILRHSFRLKLFFIFIEIALFIIFGATIFERIYAPSVVVEWLLGLFFALYMWSCAIDFFAVPDSTMKSDTMRLLGEDWEKDVGLATPGMVVHSVIHINYLGMP